MGLRTVFNRVYAILLGECEQRIHSARVTREMDGHYGAGSWRDERPYGFCSDGLSIQINIGKDGTRATAGNAACAGNISSRGHNDFIPYTNAQRQQSKFQGHAAARNSYTMHAPDGLGEFLFEPAAFLAGPVIYVAGTKHGRYCVDLVLREAGPGRQGSCANRSATVNCKLLLVG
jgi:hypothetical protein